MARTRKPEQKDTAAAQDLRADSPTTNAGALKTEAAEAESMWVWELEDQ